MISYQSLLLSTIVLNDMLSIHNNLSAGTQNVTGAYLIIILVYRHLLTMRLHGKPAV